MKLRAICINLIIYISTMVVIGVSFSKGAYGQMVRVSNLKTEVKGKDLEFRFILDHVKDSKRGAASGYLFVIGEYVSSGGPEFVAFPDGAKVKKGFPLNYKQGDSFEIKTFKAVKGTIPRSKNGKALKAMVIYGFDNKGEVVLKKPVLISSAKASSKKSRKPASVRTTLAAENIIHKVVSRKNVFTINFDLKNLGRSKAQGYMILLGKHGKNYSTYPAGVKVRYGKPSQHYKGESFDINRFKMVRAFLPYKVKGQYLSEVQILCFSKSGDIIYSGKLWSSGVKRTVSPPPAPKVAPRVVLPPVKPKRRKLSNQIEVADVNGEYNFESKRYKVTFMLSKTSSNGYDSMSGNIVLVGENKELGSRIYTTSPRGISLNNGVPVNYRKGANFYLVDVTSAEMEIVVDKNNTIMNKIKIYVFDSKGSLLVVKSLLLSPEDIRNAKKKVISRDPDFKAQERKLQQKDMQLKAYKRQTSRPLRNFRFTAESGVQILNNVTPSNYGTRKQGTGMTNYGVLYGNAEYLSSYRLSFLAQAMTALQFDKMNAAMHGYDIGMRYYWKDNEPNFFGVSSSISFGDRWNMFAETYFGKRYYHLSLSENISNPLEGEDFYDGSYQHFMIGAGGFISLTEDYNFTFRVNYAPFSFADSGDNVILQEINVLVGVTFNFF